MGCLISFSCHPFRRVVGGDTDHGDKKGDYLVNFFKRIQYKKGRLVAIVATARKLATIVWNMLVKKVEYNPVPLQQNVDKIRQIQLKNIQRKIRQLNVKEEELLFVTC